MSLSHTLRKVAADLYKIHELNATFVQALLGAGYTATYALKDDGPRSQWGPGLLADEATK